MTDAPHDHGLTLSELREITDTANIPTLLMVLYQVTGDDRWLQDPYRPTRSKGLGDHDGGGLSDEIQREIRHAGAQALRQLQAGHAAVIEVPTPDQMTRMLGVCVGEEVDDHYGEMFVEEFRRRIGVDSDVRVNGARRQTDFRVLIIGTGVSGIIAAHQLGQMGIKYLIVDQHDAPGGNWLDNRYPGVGVDTPSHLYSFSFAPNDWTMHFELRPAIQEYLAKTHQTIGAAEHTWFDTDIVRASFDETSDGWSVELRRRDGKCETYWFNAIISAVGILNRPKMPSVEGMKNFTGPSFHSSQWPEDLDVTDKNIAVIGSGASAMQIVPAIAPWVRRLTIFQRTPPWVAPFEKFMLPIDERARYLLRTVPLYRIWYWLKLYWQFGDKVLDSLRKDPNWPHPDRAVNARNDGHRQFFTEYMKDELGDRVDIFEKVLPTYPPFGKRILLDNGWYSTLCRSNVTLVDEGVSAVTSTGVVTKSGEFYNADILVWATGFQASRFVSSFEVVGRESRTLREAWDDDDARAYLGVTVPGFPNLFLLGGPNSFPGSGSFMYFMEVQMRYIARLLDEMIKENISAIDVRADVFEDYNDLVERTSETTVWTHPGTTTFFRNDRGRLVFVSPFRNVEYWTRAEQSGLSDYHTSSARSIDHVAESA